MSKYKIMTPGPVQVPENVRLARSLSTTNADLDPQFYFSADSSGTTTPTTMKQPKKSTKKYYKTKTVLHFLQQKTMELFMDSAMEIIFRPSGCQGLPAMYQV